MSAIKYDADQIAAIRGNILQATAALDAYEQYMKKHDGSDDVLHKGELAVTHNAVIKESINLVNQVRGPVDSLYAFFEMGSQASAIRCLIASGAFDKIPTEGSITVEKLAAELNADKKLLARFLRIVSVTGPLKQVAEDEYAHTEHSKAYLKPELRGMYTLM